MATQEQKNAIMTLYIGYYGRAGDPPGFAFWEKHFDALIGDGLGEAEALVRIAESFGDKSQVETVARYPFLLDPANQSADDFVVSIYINLLNRQVSTDDPGVQFWITSIANGTFSPGKVIYAIIEAALANADANVIKNKLAVANSWTENFSTNNLTFGADAIAQSRTSIARVDADTAGVIKGASDASFVASKLLPVTSFSLTTAIDTLTGTSGVNVFRGDKNTTSSDDTVIGGGQFDDLILFGTTVIPVLRDVEFIRFVGIEGDIDVAAASRGNLTATVPYTGVSRVEIKDANFTSSDRTFTLGEIGQLIFDNVTIEAGKGFELVTETGAFDIGIDGLGTSASPVKINFLNKTLLQQVYLAVAGGDNHLTLSDDLADTISKIHIGDLSNRAASLSLDLKDSDQGPAKLAQLQIDALSNVDVTMPDMISQSVQIFSQAKQTRIDMGTGYDVSDLIYAIGDLTLVVDVNDANPAAGAAKVSGISRLEISGTPLNATTINPKRFGTVAETVILDGWSSNVTLSINDFGGAVRDKLILGEEVGNARIEIHPSDASSSTDIFDFTILNAKSPSVGNGIYMDLSGHESVGIDSSAAVQPTKVTISDEQLDSLTLKNGDAQLSVHLENAPSARIIDARSTTGTGGIELVLDTNFNQSGQAIFLTQNDDTVIDGAGAANITFGAGSDRFVDRCALGVDKLLDFSTADDKVELRIGDLAGSFDTNPVPVSPRFTEIGDPSAKELSVLNDNLFVVMQNLTGSGLVADGTNIINLSGKTIANTSALQTALETGGDFALTVTVQGADVSNTFLVLYSDGTNSYLSAVQAETETINNTVFETGDLHAVNMIEFTGIANAASLSAANFLLVE